MAVEINIPKPIIDYNDLENKPDLVTKHSELSLDDGTNPHGTTASDVGLGNVDNTSDLDKPISNDTQDALDLKANDSEISLVGKSNNYNDLDNKPTIPSVTGLVPYTGANQDVDLGNNALNVKSVKVNGTGGAGHVSMKHQSAGISASASESALGADSSGNPIWKNDGNAQQKVMLENSAITGATKTKITYDSKGLVTSGADATTADIADSTNKRYVTDAQLVVIGNTSGTNSGNETASTVGALINGASSATPNDTDLVATAESSVLKKITWTNVKAFLKTYFDTIYTTTSAVATQITTALASYVPNTRTVNSKALSSNITLTPSDIGSPSGSGTSTGTNTGDETQATILSKLGYTPQAQFLSKLVFKEVFGGTTSSTAETILATFSIAANELPASTTLYFETLAYKTVATVNGTFRIRVNTSNTLTGAAQLAQWGMGGNTNVHSQNRRRFGLTGGNVYAYPASTTQNTDIITSTTAETIVAVDVTNAVYFFVTFTANSSADTLNHVYSLMKNF